MEWKFEISSHAFADVKSSEDLCAQNCALEAKMVVSKHLRQHCTLQAAILGQHTGDFILFQYFSIGYIYTWTPKNMLG